MVQRALTDDRKRKKEPEEDPRKLDKKQEVATPFERKARYIERIMACIVARLDVACRTMEGRDPRSTAVLKEVEKGLGPENKRAWQYVSSGSHQTWGDVYASNNLASVGFQTVGSAPISNLKGHITGGINNNNNVTDPGTVKVGPRQFHAESRLLAHGCSHVLVSGGLNCIFCSLYFLMHGEEIYPHFEGIKSWHVPSDVTTIVAFFGQDVVDIVAEREFQELFGAIGTVQDLVDLLCEWSSYWFG